MSKINVEFDTKEKSLSVKKDGKDVASVSEVMFYNYMYDDKPQAEMSIYTREKVDDEDMYVVTKLYASEDGRISSKKIK